MMEHGVPDEYGEEWGIDSDSDRPASLNDFADFMKLKGTTWEPQEILLSPSVPKDIERQPAYSADQQPEVTAQPPSSPTAAPVEVAKPPNPKASSGVETAEPPSPSAKAASDTAEASFKVQHLKWS